MDDLARLAKATSDRLSQRRFLHMAIAEMFNESELNLLAYELDFNPENLTGGMHEERALWLTLHMQRHGRLRELIKMLQKKRSHIDWSEFYDR